jgi:hypothetical protein
MRFSNEIGWTSAYNDFLSSKYATRGFIESCFTAPEENVVPDRNMQSLKEPFLEKLAKRCLIRSSLRKSFVLLLVA